MVGQEDLGHPLSNFAPQLIQAKLENPSLRFFFHAGETDWIESQADFNVIDAILLNATRIGHGYSITKHPEALKIIKERDIPIEICPISNQVKYFDYSFIFENIYQGRWRRVCRVCPGTPNIWLFT